MRRLRSLVKRATAYSLYYSGALWLYAEYVLRNRAVVLMYHRVLPDGSDSFSDGGIVVTPATFAANMRFLRRHFHPLSASEFHQCLEDGRFPRRACLVTFDDGWQDNADYAIPILQSAGVPATIFVATGFVETGSMFWQERLARQLYFLSRVGPVGESLLSELGLGSVSNADDLGARRSIREFVTRLKFEDPTKSDDVMQRVFECARELGASGVELGCDQFLAWDSIAQIASSSLVTIGSHAHSHTPLTRLGREGAAADLKQSLEELERHAIPRPWLCAYPNGNCDDNVIAGAKVAGLQMGFRTGGGTVDAFADKLSLPRINVHETAASSAPMFLCRILGVF